MKKAAGKRLFAGILLWDKLNNRNPQVVVRAAKTFPEDVRKAFLDTGEGLVLREELRGQFEKVLLKYDRMVKLLPSLRLAARDFLVRVRSGDELHDLLRTLFSTEVSLLFVAERLGNLNTDAEEALAAVWKSLLEETPEDGFRIRKGAERQCRNTIRTAKNRIRGSAQARKTLDRFAVQMADEELRTVFQSSAGKYAASIAMGLLLEKMEFDGFRSWKERSFRATDKGFEIRDSARGDLRKMILEIDAIVKEAEKDDF